MNKQELSQLRYLGKEIELIKKQINDAQYGFNYKGGIITDAVVGSDIGFPYTQHSIQITGVRTDGYEKRIRRLRGKLQKRLDTVIEKREQIEEYISGIEDSMIRQIFTLRYVEGMTWQQVAQNIGGGNTADSVRKQHDRYME